MTAACACAAIPAVTIAKRPTLPIPEGRPPTPYNLEELFSRGRYPDLQRYLEGVPRIEEKPSLALLLGKVRLARGDPNAASEILGHALYGAAGTRQQAEVEWALAQAFLQSNDFGRAGQYGQDALAHGQPLPVGFLRFLEAVDGTELYGGAPRGTRGEADFDMAEHDLIRVRAKVNRTPVTAVVDTGASYCILARSFAQSTGFVETPETHAYGRGFQGREIPLTFGLVDRLEVAGFSLSNVPAMVMPDEALSFPASRGELSIPAVLGLHLLKEFSVTIDYAGKKLSLTRVFAAAAKTDSRQNLFLGRGKLLVRASVNRSGWYSFLLDTGSEPTMITTAGLARMGLRSSNKLFPRKVHGIGKTRVEWGKIPRIAIGVGDYLARFDNIVVAEVDDAFEDGIIGASYLKHFRVTIDFERMALTLEPPAGTLVGADPGHRKADVIPVARRTL